MQNDAPPGTSLERTRSFTRRLYLLASLVVCVSACVHVAADPMSGLDDGSALRLYQFVLGFLMVAWLVTDPKLSNDERPSFDHALLHLIFFPFLAAYEQFVIRRWAGLAIVTAMFILLLAPLITMIATG